MSNHLPHPWDLAQKFEQGNTSLTEDFRQSSLGQAGRRKNARERRAAQTAVAAELSNMPDGIQDLMDEEFMQQFALSEGSEDGELVESDDSDSGATSHQTSPKTSCSESLGRGDEDEPRADDWEEIGDKEKGKELERGGEDADQGLDQDNMKDTQDYREYIENSQEDEANDDDDSSFGEFVSEDGLQEDTAINAEYTQATDRMSSSVADTSQKRYQSELVDNSQENWATTNVGKRGAEESPGGSAKRTKR